MEPSEKGCCHLSCWNRRTKADRACCVGLVTFAILTMFALIIAIIGYELGWASTCRKPNCVDQASRTMTMMDRSINPCEDFYQYACGGYMADTGTRDKSVLIEQINKLNDLVKVILMENVRYGEPAFLSFPKMLYRSCMDQEKILYDGVKPIRDYIKKFGGWPIVERDWDEKSFNWIVLIKRLRENGFPFGYLIRVIDIEEQGTKLLFMGGETYANLLSNGKRNEAVIASYKEHLIHMAKRFGASSERATIEVNETVEFEYSLAKLAGHDKRVERITMNNLQKRHPIINWLIFVRSCLGLNVRDNEVVLILPSYIKELGILLETTPKRVIANYMMAKVHLFIFSLLPKAIIYPKSPPQPFEEREKLCIDFIRSNLWLALGALYKNKYYEEEATVGVVQILDLIKKQYKKIIKNANWMSDSSKETALRKLEAMESQIAFPEEILDTRKLDNFHGNLGTKSTLGKWKWIDNFVTGVFLSIRRTNHIVSDLKTNRPAISSDRILQDPKEYLDISANVKNEVADKVQHRNAIYKFNLRTMGDEAKWLGVSDQIQVRAKFEPQNNMLDVRAGILRGGFYHHELPFYVNFGAIGSVLAHELVHAIDNKGKYFDENGNLRYAWKDTGKKLFEDKFKCIIDQYNNYVDPLTGLNLNGTATLDENIADNIGLEISYKAYRQWLKKREFESYLPGLNLTSTQLFWIANAQTQCANPSYEKVSKQIFLSDKAPERFRIIGSIANNNNFARDFHCPLGSPMNPKSKCIFW